MSASFQSHIFIFGNEKKNRDLGLFIPKNEDETKTLTPLKKFRKNCRKCLTWSSKRTS